MSEFCNNCRSCRDAQHRIKLRQQRLREAQDNISFHDCRVCNPLSERQLSTAHRKLIRRDKDGQLVQEYQCIKCGEKLR